MRHVVLESCHQLHRRKQFAGATQQVLRDGVNVTVVVTAPCGCENTTASGPRGASGDGSTWLCNDHAIPDEWDDDE